MGFSFLLRQEQQKYNKKINNYTYVSIFSSVRIFSFVIGNMTAGEDSRRSHRRGRTIR
jgi:hypothetical protein